MSDEQKPKQASIPSWQRAQPSPETSKDNIAAQSEQKPASEATIVGKVQIQPPVDDNTKDAAENSASESSSSEEVMSQVRAFLDDPAVKSAPKDKRRAFLESKGIDKEIIDQALNQDEEPVKRLEPVRFDASEFKSTSQQPSRPQNLVTRDVPPVVTYPEFLVQPQKPPPLVTVSRLLNTAYIAGSIGTVLYGISKYLVAPMTDHLTLARHEFAEHTETHIKQFNDKLSSIASSTPSTTKPKPTADDDDVESTASDPTELYHRDMGTQTSPALSRRDSSSSSSSHPIVAPRSTIERQEDRLRIMSSHLSELLSGSNTNGGTAVKAQESITELRDYLNELMYLPPVQIEYGSWQQSSSLDRDKKRDDAVNAFKAEIRSVKGVLLSARRFPGAAPVAAKVGG